MDLNKYQFECECGKQFKLKADNLGGELLCPACDKRLRIPQTLTPIEGSILHQDQKRVSDERKNTGFEIKKIAIGILMIVGGVLLAFISYYSWTQAGRVKIYLPVASLTLLVMGFGFTLKGLFGDAIEWD